MFRIDHIISATQFIRSFRKVADYLSRTPEPLLTTQKRGRLLIVMEGQFVEGLVGARAK
jgi:hypothetical protein